MALDAKQIGAAVFGLIIVVAVVYGYTTYYSAKPYTGQTTTTPAASTTVQPGPVITTGGSSSSSAGTTVSTTVPAQNSYTFSISESEYKFNQSVLMVTSGASVSITVRNTGTTSHGLAISFGGSVHQTPVLSPGQSATLAFTAPSAGNYTYYCPVDSHQSFGMMGTLVVK